MTLTEIVATWAPFRRSSVQTQELALKRLKICDSCPYKQQMKEDGTQLKGMGNSPDSLYYCGECGCPLWGKVKEEENYCRIGKWDEVADAESYY